MFGVEKTLLVFNLILDHLLTTIHNYKDKGRARARDTATSMNMTVDLDTDPTYEDTTEQAVVVVLPLNALIPDQMERRKSLKSGKKYSGSSVHTSSFVNNFCSRSSNEENDYKIAVAFEV